MSDARSERTVDRSIDAPPDIVFKVWTERPKAWRCSKRTPTVIDEVRPPGARR